MKVTIEVTDQKLLDGLAAACKGWNDAVAARLKKGEVLEQHPDYRTVDTYLKDRVNDLLVKYAKQHGFLPT